MNYNVINFDFLLTDDGCLAEVYHFKKSSDVESQAEIVTDERPFRGMIANLSSHVIRYHAGGRPGTLGRYQYNFFTLSKHSCLWFLPQGLNELMFIACPDDFFQRMADGAPLLKNFLALPEKYGTLNPENLTMNVTILDDIIGMLRDRHVPLQTRNAMIEVRGRNIVLAALMHSGQHHEKLAVDIDAIEVRKIYDYMVSNLSFISDTRILIDMASVPEERLREKFKSIYGESIQDTLRHERLRKAEHLILTTNQTMQEIASHVGYSSSPHFINAFYQKHGIYPTEFRKKSIGFTTPD